jgi:FkbM family methyltransferase
MMRRTVPLNEVALTEMSARNKSKTHSLSSSVGKRMMGLRLQVAIIVCTLAALSSVSYVLLGNFGKPLDLHHYRKPKLGDGCYHVYLDVGSNIGVHGRFLLEPKKYPKASKAHGLFNKHFGVPSMRDNRDICVFAFEPNPALKDRHRVIENAYKALGWKYIPIHAGVSDQEGSLTFYHQDDANRGELGFSSDPRSGRKTTAVEVPVIRLSSWLREHIHDRLLPKMVYGASDIHPKVVMKLDIEIMEYIVLPDLLFSSVLCETVDHIFGEFHNLEKFPPVNLKPNEMTGRGGLQLKDVTEKRQYEVNLLKAFHSLRSGDCKTREFQLLDDESYWADGLPLPGE